MKVAIVTTYATPRNVRGELIADIVRRGHEVVVIAPEPADVMEAPLAVLGARYRAWAVSRTGISIQQDARSAWQLLRLLASERPDVLLVYQVKAVLLAPLAAQLARIRRVVVLVNGVGTLFYDRGFGRSRAARLARRAYALSLRAADEVIFHNRDDADLMRSLGVLPSSRPWRVVSGSGIDLARWSPQPPHLDPPSFTLISRLLISKGVRELAAAARMVRRDHPRARFRVVGPLEAADHPDAVGRAELAAWIDEGLIEYVGFTDDIARILAETTVYVLPSYREGMPRTNLEALAMARPVVTADTPGCRETVIDGVNGFLVPFGDATALADRLVRYLEEPALVAAHGAAGRALAERRFGIDAINALMCEALSLDEPGPLRARGAR